MNKLFTVAFITLFSVILWGTITLQEQYFSSIFVPVRIPELPNNLAVSNLSSNMIEINIKGDGLQLAKLQLFGDKEIDFINEKTPGKYRIFLRSIIEQSATFSSNFKVNEIFPDSIEFTIEESLSKFVKVIPNFRMQFKDGYSLVQSLVCQPDSVLISGPKSIISRIKDIKTINTSYNYLNEDFSRKIKLNPLPYVEVSIPEVIVSGSIQKIVDKSFQGITVNPTNVPDYHELTLFPSRISVTLRGGLKILGKLNEQSIKANVNFVDALLDTTGSIIPVISVPEFTNVINIQPERLSYIIKKY